MIEWVRRNFNESGSENEDGFSFDESYTIHTTAVIDDAYAILDPAQLPKIGDRHRSGRATCTNRTVEHLDGSPLDWEATITYTKAATDTPTGGGETDTTNRPTLAIGSERSVVLIAKDVHGVPITNSAGDAFAEGYQAEVTHLTLTLSKQIPFTVLVPSLLKKWRDVVHGPAIGAAFLRDVKNINGGAFPSFFGMGNFEAKFVDFGASTVLAGKDTEWQVNLKFSLADGWIGSALDQGIYENKNATGEKVSPGALADFTLTNRKPIIDFMGLPVSRPVLLNGSGGRLQTGAPWFRFFQVHPNGDLNQLLQALTFPTDWNGYRIKLP